MGILYFFYDSATSLMNDFPIYKDMEKNSENGEKL